MPSISEANIYDKIIEWAAGLVKCKGRVLYSEDLDIWICCVVLVELSVHCRCQFYLVHGLILYFCQERNYLQPFR